MNAFLAASSRATNWATALSSSPAARRVPRGGVPTAVVLVAGVLIVLAAGQQYTGSVFVLAACYAIVTAGMAVQIGFSQQIAFSQSVFFGVGAYGVAMLNTHFNMSVLLATVIMMVGAALAALLLGSVVTRASGLALAVATLMLPLIAVGYVSASGYLGGAVGAPLIGTLWPSSSASTAVTAVGGGIIVVVLLAAAVFVAARILNSDIGLELFVLGVDERTAAALGVRTPRRKLELFVLGCVFAALGGAVYAGTQQFVPETVVDPTTELALLIMLFIGGRRSVIGAVIGALVIQYLQGASNWVSVNILVVEGVLLTVVLLVDPEGLAGIVQTGVAWLRRTTSPAGADGTGAEAPPEAPAVTPGMLAVQRAGGQRRDRGQGRRPAGRDAARGAGRLQGVRRPQRAARRHARAARARPVRAVRPERGGQVHPAQHHRRQRGALGGRGHPQRHRHHQAPAERAVLPGRQPHLPGGAPHQGPHRA